MVGKAIELLPNGQVIGRELFFNREFIVEELVVDIPGMDHHAPYIFKKMWAMRIMFCIAEFVVHAMHHRIGTGHQIRRALCKPGEQVEDAFAVFTGGVHLVTGKAMQEKCVKEQRQKPMHEKENKDSPHNKKTTVR